MSLYTHAHIHAHTHSLTYSTASRSKAQLDVLRACDLCLSCETSVLPSKKLKRPRDWLTDGLGRGPCSLSLPGFIFLHQHLLLWELHAYIFVVCLYVRFNFFKNLSAPPGCTFPEFKSFVWFLMAFPALGHQRLQGSINIVKWVDQSVLDLSDNSLFGFNIKIHIRTGSTI